MVSLAKAVFVCICFCLCFCSLFTVMALVC